MWIGQQIVESLCCFDFEKILGNIVHHFAGYDAAAAGSSLSRFVHYLPYTRKRARFRSERESEVARKNQRESIWVEVQ